jgi:hypothetical protein
MLTLRPKKTTIQETYARRTDAKKTAGDST